jgi:hypothetical protein
MGRMEPETPHRAGLRLVAFAAGCGFTTPPGLIVADREQTGSREIMPNVRSVARDVLEVIGRDCLAPSLHGPLLNG